MKRFFENKKKIIVLVSLSLFCTLFIGCKGMEAKFFENNGRFILLKDNIPANSILLQSGELFSPGGIDTRSKKIIPAQIYDLKTHKAKLQNTMIVPRIASSTILLDDGKILIIGGYLMDKRGNYGGIPTKYAEIFNPSTKTFLSISDMNYAKGIGTYCELLNDGRVFIISPQTPVEIYNPKTQKFSVVGNIKKYNLKSYGPNFPATFAEYSTLNRFTIAKPILLKDGRVLIVGASLNDGNAEIFDPKTNSFIHTGQMVSRRIQFTATLLNDGRVLITGGRKNIGGYGIDSVEIFDPNTNSFNVVGSLNIKRYDHSAVLLSNGKVLIVNGQYGHSEDLRYLRDAELFNPKTETFVRIGSTHNKITTPKLINISKSQVLLKYGSKAEIYKY